MGEKSSVAPVETAVQKCRRKQKENEFALKEKDLALSAEQTQKIEKMLELKGELNILSRLSGASPFQEIQDCINKVAEAEGRTEYPVQVEWGQSLSGDSGLHQQSC